MVVNIVYRQFTVWPLALQLPARDLCIPSVTLVSGGQAACLLTLNTLVLRQWSAYLKSRALFARD
jgi:hypothetical protein